MFVCVHARVSGGMVHFFILHIPVVGAGKFWDQSVDTSDSLSDHSTSKDMDQRVLDHRRMHISCLLTTISNVIALIESEIVLCQT